MANQVKLYRTDDYYQNSGQLQGFYDNFEDALLDCDCKESAEMADGNFSQITAFMTDSRYLMWLDHDPKKLLEKAWPEGEIVETYYFI
jgi:hypothetical protein